MLCSKTVQLIPVQQFAQHVSTFDFKLGEIANLIHSEQQRIGDKAVLCTSGTIFTSGRAAETTQDLTFYFEIAKANTICCSKYNNSSKTFL
jgi:hypothetical protein